MDYPRRVSQIVFGRSLIAALWMASAGAVAIRAEPAGLPDETRRALEENARKLGPLTVAWERTRRSDFSEAEFLAKAHYSPSDWGVLAPYKSRYIRQETTFYDYSQWMVPATETKDGIHFAPTRAKPLLASQHEVSFDGKAIYFANPLPQMDPVISIDPIERLAAKEPKAHLIRQYYLKEAGFLVPETPVECRDGAPARSLILALIADGAQVEGVGPDQVDGVQMQAVDLATADRRLRFTLDPRKSFAIRRRVERTKSGALAVAVDGSDFEKLPKSSLWLPRRIQVESHALREAPGLLTAQKLLVESYRVTELNDDPVPPERFALKYDKPGTLIADGTLPGAEKQPDGRVSYRQPASPEDLEGVILAATESGYKPKSQAMLTVIFWTSNGVAFVALLSYAIYVRRKRTASKAS
jgi:hypothetical protein